MFTLADITSSMVMKINYRTSPNPNDTRTMILDTYTVSQLANVTLSLVCLLYILVVVLLDLIGFCSISQPILRTCHITYYAIQCYN
jgi:hypothetical protein